MSETPAPRRAARGFTLIEIMVVIAIIGLLATFVAPYAMQKWRQANVTASKGKMVLLKTPIESYFMLHSRVPDSLEELLEPDEKNMDEPYIESQDQIKDAWGNLFVYEKLNNKKYDIISLGADGAEGGEADDADIHLLDSSSGSGPAPDR
jgi:general secretion pathway protein G